MQNFIDTCLQKIKHNGITEIVFIKFNLIVIRNNEINNFFKLCYLYSIPESKLWSLQRVFISSLF